jgi:hypothetical protein
VTRKKLIYLLSIFQKFSLLITTIQYQKNLSSKINKDPTIASLNLQEHIHSNDKWLQK